MPALATRPRRLALACALITAVTLGTVSASAATASDSPGASHDTDRPPIGKGLGVAYAPTDDAPDDVTEANKAFARCMRGEGQKQFPDFHAFKDEDGSIRLQVKVKAGEFQPVAKKYRAAIKKCAPLLKDAGITLPDAPDLPAPPEGPGKPGHHGKDELPKPPKHVKPGDTDNPGLPSLTDVIESA